MVKAIYISLVLLFLQGDVFGQTAQANISATITNPVGAEFTETSNADVTAQNVNNTGIRVIGEVFSHSVSKEQNNSTTQVETNKKTTTSVSYMVSFD